MAFKARSDWLLKFPITFASHLRATCLGFVPENIVLVARVIIVFLCYIVDSFSINNNFAAR